MCRKVSLLFKKDWVGKKRNKTFPWGSRKFCTGISVTYIRKEKLRGGLRWPESETFTSCQAAKTFKITLLAELLITRTGKAFIWLKSSTTLLNSAEKQSNSSEVSWKYLEQANIRKKKYFCAKMSRQDKKNC